MDTERPDGFVIRGSGQRRERASAANGPAPRTGQRYGAALRGGEPGGGELAFGDDDSRAGQAG